jgi:hypothetical protein
MYNTILWVWVISCVIINGIWLTISINLHVYKKQIDTSIELCEKELPRNINCDYTIVSKPVLENTEINIKEVK